MGLQVPYLVCILVPDLGSVKGAFLEIPEKMRAIRAREGLTQAQFCELVGMNLSSWKKYELAVADMGLMQFLKVTKHTRFKKYALWLSTDEVAPECGQISPVD